MILDCAMQLKLLCGFFIPTFGGLIFASATLMTFSLRQRMNPSISVILSKFFNVFRMLALKGYKIQFLQTEVDFGPSYFCQTLEPPKERIKVINFKLPETVKDFEDT
ncbi:hypothetical protein TNIN_401941 [Trichonephila inaurata madagascariensis]|uniref:Uncharacterized protein n=1 Tax=Trichonephila inaurata madagascariensis TaxID=2747483 RepID=A0A8X7CAH2_9ARAC|nr:hypothetical protein TNIN_401941 [Trichonephila inaurata madagascariensis]